MATAPHLFDEQQRLLQPPQFRLRTLMIVTAVCCGLFALFSVVSLLLSTFIVLLLVLIGAHVIGNAVGTRLRDGAPAPELVIDDSQAAQIQAADQFAGRPQRLRETTALDRRTILWTATGAIAGGILGGVGLSVVNWANISLPAGILATCSSAVLGGLAAFLATCFITTLRCAWREALDNK